MWRTGRLRRPGSKLRLRGTPFTPSICPAPRAECPRRPATKIRRHLPPQRATSFLVSHGMIEVSSACRARPAFERYARGAFPRAGEDWVAVRGAAGELQESRFRRNSARAVCRCCCGCRFRGAGAQGRRNPVHKRNGGRHCCQPPLRRAKDLPVFVTWLIEPFGLPTRSRSWLTSSGVASHLAAPSGEEPG